MQKDSKCFCRKKQIEPFQIHPSRFKLYFIEQKWGRFYTCSHLEHMSNLRNAITYITNLACLSFAPLAFTRTHIKWAS